MVTKEDMRYLRECWGYAHIGQIDSQTLDCLRENAVDGYSGDQNIVREYYKMKALPYDDSHWAKERPSW